MGQIVRQFLGHVLPGVMRPLQVLWNQIIGFFFVCFGLSGAVYVYRGVRQLDTPQGSLARVAVPLLFAVVMFYFGITSFLRARKISRS
jgi:hypothetical protein